MVFHHEHEEHEIKTEHMAIPSSCPSYFVVVIEQFGLSGLANKRKKAIGYFYWQSVSDHGLGAASPQ